MTRQEEKQQLRAIVRRLEAALAPEYRAKSARSIAHRLLAMPEYQEAQTVFCFVGTDREIDTRPILEDILAAGKTLCVPLCTEPGRMESRQITDLNQLVPGRYGLLEPTADTPVRYFCTVLSLIGFPRWVRLRSFASRFSSAIGRSRFSLIAPISGNTVSSERR